MLIIIPIPKTTVDKSNGRNTVCRRWTSSPYRQYAFVVRLDIQHFCSSSLSTNILGIGITLNPKKFYSFFGFFYEKMHFCNYHRSAFKLYISQQ